jgi:hypothetical protein
MRLLNTKKLTFLRQGLVPPLKEQILKVAENASDLMGRYRQWV